MMTRWYVTLAAGLLLLIGSRPPHSMDQSWLQAALASPSHSQANQVESFLQMCLATAPETQEGHTVAAILESVLDASPYAPQNLPARCQKAAQLLVQKRSLDLSRQQITTIDPLLTLRFLQYLNLSFNQITEVRALGRLPLLQRIDLDGNPVEDLNELMESSRARIYTSDSTKPYLGKTYQTRGN